MAQVVEQDDIMDGHTLLSYMTIKGQNSFAWGPKDFLQTLNEDILLAPVNPVPVNNRGYFGFEKTDYEKALRLMVVLHLLSILLLSTYQFHFKMYSILFYLTNYQNIKEFKKMANLRL